MPIKPSDLPLKKVAAENYTFDNIVSKIESRLLKAHEDDQWPVEFKFKPGTSRILVDKIRDSFDVAGWNAYVTCSNSTSESDSLDPASEVWNVILEPKPSEETDTLSTIGLTHQLMQKFPGVQVTHTQEVSRRGDTVHTVKLTHGHNDTTENNLRTSLYVDVCVSSDTAQAAFEMASKKFEDTIEYSIDPTKYCADMQSVVEMWNKMEALWGHIHEDTPNYYADYASNDKLIHESLYGLWHRGAEALRTHSSLCDLLARSTRQEIKHALDRYRNANRVRGNSDHAWLARQKPNFPPTTKSPPGQLEAS